MFFGPVFLSFDEEWGDSYDYEQKCPARDYEIEKEGIGRASEALFDSALIAQRRTFAAVSAFEVESLRTDARTRRNADEVFLTDAGVRCFGLVLGARAH